MAKISRRSDCLSRKNIGREGANGRAFSFCRGNFWSMKNYLAGLCLFCLPAMLPTPSAAVHRQPPAVNRENWFTFTSTEGRFSVLVPATMDEKVTKTTTAIGALAYHTFVCQPAANESENLLYMVSYCDYPEGTVHSDSTELLADFFAATVDESVQSIRGELAYSADFQWAGLPGKVWRVDYNRGTATLRTKILVSKNRVYTLQTACRRAASLNDSADRFFDSFKVF